MTSGKVCIVCLGLMVGLVWAGPAMAKRGGAFGQDQGPQGGFGQNAPSTFQQQNQQQQNLQQQKKAMRSGGAKKIPRGNPPGWAPARGLRQQTGTPQTGQLPPGLQKKQGLGGTQQQGQMGPGGQMGQGGQQGLGGQPGGQPGNLGQQGQPSTQQPPPGGVR